MLLKLYYWLLFTTVVDGGAEGEVKIDEDTDVVVMMLRMRVGIGKTGLYLLRAVFASY